VTRGMQRIGNEKMESKQVVAEVTKEVDYVRQELALNRGVLERIQLGKRKSLRLVPAEWQTDLNGDGKLEIWEKYFYAIPRRNNQSFRFGMPNAKLDYYLKETNLDAAIRVDQSDVLWTLAYHQFIEGAFTMVRAFDADIDHDFKVTLARPALLKKSHALIGSGIATSEKMRRSVLAETSDDEEWIGNPRQQSSVFPMALDDGDFTLWGDVLKEMNAVWQGRHLIPVDPNGRGPLGEIAHACPAGSGLNVASVFLDPPPAGTVFSSPKFSFNPKHCQRVTAKRPAVALEQFTDRMNEANKEWNFLRYLYWTN
jgi:hypothetical protein